MHVDLREFRSAYLAEVDEHLAAIGHLLLALDEATRSRRAAPRELRELMRLVHTVKGLSAMVGVEPIVEIAHRMENVLRAADAAGGTAPDASIELLGRATRAIEARVRAVAEDERVPAAPAALLAELDTADVGTEARGEAPVSLGSFLDEKLTASEKAQLAQGAAAGRRAVRVDFAPSPERAAGGRTITAVRERLADVGEIVKVIPIATAPNEEAPGGLVFAIFLSTHANDEDVAVAAGVEPRDVQLVVAARAAERASAAEIESASPAVGRGVLRVEIGRIDEAIEKLSSLIVTRWRLQRAADALTAAGAPTRELVAILADNARQLSDMRAAILRVRMVPMATVLERLPLVVRTVAKTTGKQVQLLIAGGSAELDKTVAERLFPALVHLLRNAVDHGIETPEERTRAGKPPQGTIRITCTTSDRWLALRVEDDGRGIDRQALAARYGAPAALVDDEALLDLVCRPGLSTRAEADATSGRGVGMDVVRKIVVDGLGGELAVETRAGAHTAFALRVPLTIAVVDGFVATCAGERFVVPVPVVEEVVDMVPAHVVANVGGARGLARSLLVRRGEAMPLVDLAEALGLPDARATAVQALVVRRMHETPVAFAIQRVLGQKEAVVRPLVDPLVTVPGIAGSTDLGDGRATLVLDLHALVARVDGAPSHEEEAA